MIPEFRFNRLWCCIFVAVVISCFCSVGVLHAAGEEADSGEVLQPGLSPPQSVIAMDTPRDGGLSITIQWESPSGDGEFSGYRIYRSDAPDGEFVLLGDVDAQTKR